MLLSSNGPPLRTTTTWPPSALVNPEAKAMPGTTTPSTTTSAMTSVSSLRRPRWRRGGWTGITPGASPAGFFFDDGNVTGTISPAARSAGAAADCSDGWGAPRARRAGTRSIEQGADRGGGVRGPVQRRGPAAAGGGQRRAVVHRPRLGGQPEHVQPGAGPGQGGRGGPGVGAVGGHAVGQQQDVAGRRPGPGQLLPGRPQRQVQVRRPTAAQVEQPVDDDLRADAGRQRLQ